MLWLKGKLIPVSPVYMGLRDNRSVRVVASLFIFTFLVSKSRQLQNDWYSCVEVTREHTVVFIFQMWIIKMLLNLHLFSLFGLHLMHFNTGVVKTFRITVKLAHNQEGVNSHTKEMRVQQTWARWSKWPARDALRFCRAKGEWAVHAQWQYSCETQVWKTENIHLNHRYW